MVIVEVQISDIINFKTKMSRDIRIHRRMSFVFRNIAL